MGALNGTLDEQLQTITDMQTKYEGMSDWQQKWGEGKGMADEIANGLQAVNDKLSDMVIKQSVLDLLNSGLDGAAQYAYDLALQMGMIDEATYNAMTTQQNFKDFLTDTEDVDTYGAALAWMADNLDRLHDKTFTVTQIVNMQQSHERSVGLMEAMWGDIPGYANGGSFTVPQGYSNDSYLMGVSSGEHVQVTPAGQNTSGQFTIVINNPIVTDEDSFKRMVEPAVIEVVRRQEAIRGGN